MGKKINMKKICYCKNYQKFGFKDVENNAVITCGHCSNPLRIQCGNSRLLVVE